MLKALKWGFLAGLVGSIMLIVLGVFPLASFFVILAWLAGYTVITAQNTTKTIWVSTVLCFAIELVAVVLYGMYDQSQMDPSRPKMSILGVYLFLFIPITYIVQAIISVILAIRASKRR